jgi:hypothetical protein
LDQENSQLLEEKNSSRRLEVSDCKRKNDGVWWDVSVNLGPIFFLGLAVKRTSNPL